MDEEKLTAEINTFIQSKDVDKKTKDKMKSRLRESINFMASLGVGISDTPLEAHYDKLDEYLHTLIQPRGKHKGLKFSDSVIEDWKSITKKFYVRNGKSSEINTTAETQISIPEFEPAPVPDGQTDSPEISHTVSDDTTDNYSIPKGEHNMTDYDNSAVTAEAVQTTQPQPVSPVEAVRKPGRPETTGRTEKFTLYMTSELWKKITMLADLDEVKITDLMNYALEYYCEKERSEDIAFLYTLERRKQEHRLQKARA